MYAYVYIYIYIMYTHIHVLLMWIIALVSRHRVSLAAEIIQRARLTQPQQ